MRKHITHIITGLAFVMVVASCGTTSKVDTKEPLAELSAMVSPATIINKVETNKVQTENIVGNASVRLMMGAKEITLSGALKMKRNKVIRLQVFMPILGTEVGRLEFTPDYVLVMDRMNKQYVRVPYSDMTFLRNSGIDFYTLQSLFWNELLTEGGHAMTKSVMNRYQTAPSTDDDSVLLTLDEGKICFQWNVDRGSAYLTSAQVSHQNLGADGPMMRWGYADFDKIGGKKYPKTHDITFSINKRGERTAVGMRVSMNELRTTSDWEAQTEVSSKYRQVSLDDVMNKLMKM